MKIIVFVKQVPNSDDVKLDPHTGNLKREGVESVMNPLDANAIEAALQIKEKHGATIAAVSMGPPQAADVLKKALALGCDEAYLLSDRAFGGADTLATSYTLAQAARKIGDWDLLIFGRNASDGDTAQTGSAVAAQLNVPQISFALSVDVEDASVVCQREFDGKLERVKATLPAMVSVCREANKPRYPKPINIMKAAKKPITVWDASALDAEAAKCGIAGSPSVTKRVFAPERVSRDTVYIEGNAEEIAVSIADELTKRHLI